METTADRLRSAIKLRRTNPTKVAVDAGISRAALYFILDGTSNPSNLRDATIAGLCRSLRVTRDWLLEGKGAGPLPDDPTEDEGPASATDGGESSQPGRLNPSTLRDAMKLLALIERMQASPPDPDLYPERLAVAYQAVFEDGAVTDESIVEKAAQVATRLRSVG